MSFSLIFRPHLVSLFYFSFYYILSTTLLLLASFYALHFISFQVHSSCVFCLYQCFYVCFCLFLQRLTLAPPHRPLRTCPAVVLLIHCFVMQEDKKVPFEKRARPIAPHVDVVHHILRVCTTMSIAFHHSPPATVVYTTQRKPCGTRARYQHPCCFVVFSTFYFFLLTVLSGCQNAACLIIIV